MNNNLFRSKHLSCRIFGLALLCLVSMSVPAIAESQFTQGFRGIAWGTHKDQLPDIGLKSRALANIYKIGHSSAFLMAGACKLKMEMDGVPLLTIFLNFFDQRFYGADLIFDPQHRTQIYAILVKDTGMDGVKTEKGDRWQMKGFSINLTEREAIIVSEAYDPEKSSSALISIDMDAHCCQGKG